MHRCEQRMSIDNFHTFMMTQYCQKLSEDSERNLISAQDSRKIMPFVIGIPMGPATIIG